jgi:hypothetical protein
MPYSFFTLFLATSFELAFEARLRYGLIILEYEKNAMDLLGIWILLLSLIKGLK